MIKEQMKRESNGRNERLIGKKGASFIRRFPGFAR
jgi:hypothetical protein